MNVVNGLKTNKGGSALWRSLVMITVETTSNTTVRYNIGLRNVAPGSRLMRPDNEGSFNAIAVVDQIGFTSDGNGRGTICRTIQRIGKKIASENRFSNCAAVAISGPIATETSMIVATNATACCASTPLAIARIGVAASNTVRR